MRDIETIIRDAGGVVEISKRAGARPDGRPALTESAVHKWRGNGIPERHWPQIIDMAQATVEEIFAANQAVRDGRAA